MTQYTSAQAKAAMSSPPSPPHPQLSGSSSTAGIAPADVIALLRALSRARPEVVSATADMLEGAVNGAPLAIDGRDLGIDPALVMRLLRAAGTPGPPVHSSLEELFA